MTTVEYINRLLAAHPERGRIALHDPLCWQRHGICALLRVRDFIQRQESDDEL